MTRVLVAGIPRSGTTWVGRTLGHAEGAVYVDEPDNENLRSLALRAKRGLGRFPVLAPGDSADTYELLWARAFGGGMPHPPLLRDRIAARLFDDGRSRNVSAMASYGSLPVRLRLAAALAPTRPRPDPPLDVVVKSVHAALAVGWIVERHHPQVVVVLRHPFSVLASQAAMGLPDGDRALDQSRTVARRLLEPWGVDPPPPTAPPLARAAWQLGLLVTALAKAAALHPGWTVVRHEELCATPEACFRGLCQRLGLRWTDSLAQFLEASNRPGSGFRTDRVAAEEVERWRSRLTSEQRDQVRSALSAFPLATEGYEVFEGP